MNVFSKVKALWTVKTFATSSIKEGKRMNGSKPGWKTTEFWLTLLTNVSTLVAALKGVVPDQAALIIVASANGIYGIIRAISKATTPPAPTA